ncbi:TRAP transporter small permease [Paracoccus seriniphilus]|uniref:TRAP transporter small permease protein n=1 Tax=Paracoccus seriniphilus TaxID=184748 RepID=A0A239Q041_9RHOB|nr:TRAP transporter small permease [Paracoccus seriniphilus]WCR15699.1 TRAP transporter small permease subunit [Paracoccus seriniphilus]SNT75623.1 TRAP-type C4-dicarboxylate transport system, small permease component [Paracoccus seriniphilus]
MFMLHGPIRCLSWVNERLLKIGYGIGIFAIAVMVAVTLVQVFCRYLLNNALPWPDEAARFCMLWMTGLMAPTAFRRGGFVAIDILPTMLPQWLGSLLNLVLLSLSLIVLAVALKLGWSEVTGIGGRFASASLFVPTAWDFSAWYRLPRSWMMASLLVGFLLLLLVNIELILRNLAVLCGLHGLALNAEPRTGGSE